MVCFKQIKGYQTERDIKCHIISFANEIQYALSEQIITDIHDLVININYQQHWCTAEQRQTYLLSFIIQSIEYQL